MRASVWSAHPPGPSPSGNPNGILPQSPGLRRLRRYPGCGCEVRHNPEGGCADGSNGWYVRCVRCVYFVDHGHTFRADSSSAPVNLIPFRPLISHPPTGTNGTTPCGVGNALRPEPGVAPGTAQPRAVWHNVVDVGEGVRRWWMDDGRGWYLASPNPGVSSPNDCAPNQNN